MSFPPNPSDPSDPSNFSTSLTPPRSLSPRTTSSLPPPPLSSSSTSSSSPPTLSSITSSLLKTSLSLKGDFRFLKLTFREISPQDYSHRRSSFHIALNESETHKLLQASLNKLNSATRRFVRDAESFWDEEINRSFDAYLHGRLPPHRFGRQFDGDEDSDSDSGYSSPEGDEEELENILMSTEEKETRRKLEELVGVVEELRGVFFKKAGKYLLGAKKMEGDEEEVESLVVGMLLNGDREGGYDREEGKNVRREDDDDTSEGLERLAKLLRIEKWKMEEVRGCKL